MVILAIVATVVAVTALVMAAATTRRLRRLQPDVGADDDAGRLEDLERRIAELERPVLDRPTADADHRSETPDHLTDSGTGLFSEGYFRVALEARLSAARRHLRPVAVVLLDVVEGLEDGLPRPTDPSAVADGVRETVRDADTACRMNDGRFALVLEDTPENGAIWTIERDRRHLADHHPGQTLWAGVACYPAHAFDSDEILKQAEEALTNAREWRQDRIEVATAT
jgi:diguanylate cyclase (GGDEF)-like protein